MRPVFSWNLGSRSLELGKRTLVMGIVNVTPDSFSDGGQHFAPESAIAHALKLLEDGADIVDIGGESTRPGARVGSETPSVSEHEELRRVLPVIQGVKRVRPEAVISVDTYKSGVALVAVEAGAEIVNDGFGFGKRFEENQPLLRRFDEFHELRFPLLAGVSRKSFIGRMLARNGKEPAVTDRLFGTLGAEVTLILKGAHLIRTHNVQACIEAAKLVDLVAS